MELPSPHLMELLDSYADQIEELRESLPVEKHRSVDDLILLRYLLSFRGSVPQAVSAILQALEWRDAHATLVAAARICEDELDSSPLREYIAAEHLLVIDACLKASFSGSTQRPPGFPLYVIQSGRSKLKELMGLVPIDSVALWLTWRNEIGFWRCDAASRRDGYLIKQVIVMSLAGSTLTGQDPRFFVAYGQSSSRSEWLHPQLLGRMVVVHPPVFMAFFWALGRRLVSQRLLQKVYVHSGPPAEHLRSYFTNSDAVAPLLANLAGDPIPSGATVDDIHAAELATAWVESMATIDRPLPEELLCEDTMEKIEAENKRSDMHVAPVE